MTLSRLEELLEKSKDNQLSIGEIAEICGETLKSLSRHSSEIKNKLNDIEKKLAQIESELSQYNSNKPVFGIIDEMDED
jgi:septation ring formation regulator EzrA